MARIALQPCAASESLQHYADTIERPVRLDRANGLPPAVLRRLSELHPSGSAPMWGLVPGPNNINSHAALRAGDEVLFAGAGRYFARATVTATWRDAALARALWGTEGDEPAGRTWELMYSITPPADLDVSYADLNTAVGYKPNKVPQGFQLLNQEKSDQVAALLGVDQQAVAASEYERVVSAPEGDLEREITTRARVEQLYLRQRLFGRSATAGCGICQTELPVDLLVAAHIKKRADCSREEKLDADNIVMAACKLGCDELYERGYVAVSDNGRLVTTSRPVPPALAAVLEKIEGRQIAAHRPATRAYFAAHREGVFRRREQAEVGSR